MTYIVQVGYVELGEFGVINRNPKKRLKTPEQVYKFFIKKGFSKKTSLEVKNWCENTPSGDSLIEYEWDKKYGHGYAIRVEK